MDMIKQIMPYTEGECHCPDCGMKLPDSSNKTLQEHFKKDCMGIVANSLRAYGVDLSDAEMGWIRCPKCDSLHLETINNQCVCGECGTLIPDGPVLLMPSSDSLFSRISQKIRSLFHG